MPACACARACAQSPMPPPPPLPPPQQAALREAFAAAAGNDGRALTSALTATALPPRAAIDPTTGDTLLHAACRAGAKVRAATDARFESALSHSKKTRPPLAACCADCACLCISDDV